MFSDVLLLREKLLFIMWALYLWRGAVWPNTVYIPKLNPAMNKQANVTWHR